MLRSVLLAASQSRRVKRLIEKVPLTSETVRRFVGGTNVTEVLDVTGRIVAQGQSAVLDRLGVKPVTPQQAIVARDEYIGLLGELSSHELTPAAEITLRLSALGHMVDREMAFDHAYAICECASAAGTMVTLETENDATVDSLWDVLVKLWGDFPTTGVVVNAYLRRAEADCRELAALGARVRLRRGPHSQPESTAYRNRFHIDRSFVRCMNILLSGNGYPMIETHDSRMIAIAEDRAQWFDRTRDGFEFQMMYGVRQDQCERLLKQGYTLRVNIPFGPEWYRCLLARLAERPAHMGLLMNPQHLKK